MQLLNRLVIAMMMACSCIRQKAPGCPQLLHTIQTMPHSGVLKESAGLVYVDLDDAYIHRLITFIQEDGFEEPPYFGSSDLVGAHISVIYSSESRKYGMGEIQECGETIHFTPKTCQIVVHPPEWKEADAVYIITVEALELDQLREKYGLPPSKYPFHITIGIKPKITKSLNSTVLVLKSPSKATKTIKNLSATSSYQVSFNGW